MSFEPPEISETMVERKIREAVEQGLFDDLPGAGEPLPDLDGRYEPTWWVRKWMKRENITAEELREGLRKRR